MAYLPDSESDFQDAIREAVAEALPGAIAEGIQLALRRELLSPDEVCELTGWSRRKLDYLKAERRIPFLKRGRTVLYRTKDIEAFLEEGRVSAKSRGAQEWARHNAAPGAGTPGAGFKPPRPS